MTGSPKESTKATGVQPQQMQILSLWLILCLSIVSLEPARLDASSQRTHDTLLSSFETVLERVVALRHLPPLRPIAHTMRNRSQIQTLLRVLLDTEVPPETWERERKALHAWGALPAAFPLKTFVLDLLTEQAAGYYDSKQQRLFIAEWLPDALQQPTLAHELVHALQDQHYDLQQHFAPIQEQADRTLARQALLEGDAMAVMLAYQLQPLGIPLTQLPDLESIGQPEHLLVGDQFQVFNRAPLVLKQQLLFPYLYGLRFVKVALSRGGWSAVEELYRHPPESTAQIMHPDKYFSPTPEPPQAVALRLPATLPGGWRKLKRDVLGEFLLSVILQQFLPAAEARQSAAGWRGDRYALFEQGETERLLLVSITVWNDAAQAAEFEHSYTALLDQKYPQWETTTLPDGSGQLRQHNDQRVLLRRRGHVVQLVEEAPAVLLPDLRTLLDDVTDTIMPTQD